MIERPPRYRRRPEPPSAPPTAREFVTLLEKLHRDVLALQRGTKTLLVRIEPVPDLEDTLRDRNIDWWQRPPKTTKEVRDWIVGILNRVDGALADLRMIAAKISDIADRMDRRGEFLEWLKERDKR